MLQHDRLKRISPALSAALACAVSLALLVPAGAFAATEGAAPSASYAAAQDSAASGAGVEVGVPADVAPANPQDAPEPEAALPESEGASPEAALPESPADALEAAPAADVPLAVLQAGMFAEGSLSSTVYWGIAPDGILYIKPMPGRSEGSFSNVYGQRPSFWPYRESVKKVVVQGNVSVSQGGALHALFDGFSNLTHADLDRLDTANATSMEAMFYRCFKLESLDLSGFDTRQVANMNTMFAGCMSLATLDLSTFSTFSVTGMSAMFNDCTNLTSLDLSNFNTWKVTDAHDLFRNCGNLVAVKIGQGFSFAPKGAGSDRAYLPDNANRSVLGDDGLLRTFTGRWFVEELLSSPANLGARPARDFPTSLQIAGWVGGAATLRAEMNVSVPGASEWLSRVPGGDGGVKWGVSSDFVLHFFPANGLHGTFSLGGGYTAWSMGFGTRLTGAVVHEGVAVAEGGSANNMFQDCRSMVSVDLTGLDVSKASSMDRLFENCRSLVSVRVGPDFAFKGYGPPTLTGPVPDRGDGLRRVFTGEWYLEEQAQANGVVKAYAAADVPATLAQAGWFDGPATWRAVERELPDTMVPPVIDPDDGDKDVPETQPGEVVPLPAPDSASESGLAPEAAAKGGARAAAAQAPAAAPDADAEAPEAVQVTVSVTLAQPLLLDAEGRAHPDGMRLANEGDGAVRLAGLALSLADGSLPGGSWTVTARAEGSATGGFAPVELVSAVPFRAPGKVPLALFDGPVVEPGSSVGLHWEGQFGSDADRLAQLAREANGLLEYGAPVPVVACVQPQAA